MLKVFSQLPIRVKLLSSSAFTLILISIFIFTYYPNQQRLQVKKALENKVMSMAEMFALNTGIALGSNNFSAISEAMNWAKRDSILSYISLIDSSGEEFAAYNPDSIKINFTDLLNQSGIVETADMLQAVVPIQYLNSNYGTLLLGYSLEKLNRDIARNTKTTLYISLVILIMGIMISLIFSHLLTKPIMNLRDAADEFGKGNYDVDINVDSFDEIGVLGKTFKQMGESIKQTMDALQKSQKELSDITSTIGEGVCVLDNLGMLTFINPEGERLLGWKESELLGKNLHHLIHFQKNSEEDISGRDCSFAQIVNQQVNNHDDLFITKNKEIISVAYISTLIKENNEIAGSVVAFHDIKERKKFIQTITDSEEKYRLLSEELTDTNNMKELLFDIITHDLKNPAGVINGFAGILLEKEPDDQVAKAINSSSTTLLKVIENATALAGVAMGESISKQSINIHQMLLDVKSGFDQIAKHANVVIEFQSPGDVYINANPILAEIFKNYLSNAVKYAKDGKRINIELIEKDNSVLVQVKDFGTQIPEESREAIFLRQARLNNGEVKGRGLGLAIVKRIASAHRAKVWVIPNKPTGNCFSFEIPK